MQKNKDTKHTPKRIVVGRPPKWNTEEEFRLAAEEYFNSTPMEDWTVTGIALALGTSRDVIMDYQRKPEFSNTIKMCKLLVENSYELDNKHFGRTGSIFALKNMGWVDKIETVNKNLNTDVELDLDEEDDEDKDNGSEE